MIKNLWYEKTLDKNLNLYKPIQNIQLNGYIDYIEFCWKNHKTAIISPEQIFHIILFHTSLHIKDNTELYRSLFTTSNEKQEIIINTSSEELPLDELIIELQKLIPSDISKFINQFTTSTQISTFTNYLAFADLVSNYYNYGVYMCGIPSIQVHGIKEDYEKIINFVIHFKTICKTEDMVIYYDNCIQTINKIINKEIDNFVNFELCGSGSQSQIFLNSLILNLYHPKYSDLKAGKRNNKSVLTQNINSCIANIEYTVYPIDKKIKLSGGLFKGIEENNVIYPYMDIISKELKEKKPFTKKDYDMIDNAIIENNKDISKPFIVRNNEDIYIKYKDENSSEPNIVFGVLTELVTDKIIINGEEVDNPFMKQSEDSGSYLAGQIDNIDVYVTPKNSSENIEQEYFNKSENELEFIRILDLDMLSDLKITKTEFNPSND